MLKDEPAEQGLPVSGDGVHFVNGYAGADGGEGVAGEVEVGHGIYGEGIALLKTGQMVAETAPLLSQVTAADACHHGGHHGPVIQFREIFCYGLPNGFVRQIGLL